ncbi:hypothetical protein HBB16_05520 [Pseudonocardia sp. MCCB 268]|nr:hypothetical protein [Pseudonocardia cytotoxica]
MRATGGTSQGPTSPTWSTPRSGGSRVRAGRRIRPLSTRDLLRSGQGDRPEHRAVVRGTRNVALFSNVDGSYDRLAAYLKRNKGCHRVPGPGVASGAAHLADTGRRSDTGQHLRARWPDTARST